MLVSRMPCIGFRDNTTNAQVTFWAGLLLSAVDELVNVTAW